MILFDLVKKLLGVNNVDEVTDEMITDYYNKTCNAMPEDTVAKPTEETPAEETTPTETTVTDIPASDTPVVVETEIEEDGSKEVKATDLATGEEVKVTVPSETEKKLVVNACGDKKVEKKVVNAGCEQLTEEDIKKAALNKSVAITKDYVDGLHGDDFFKFLHSNKDLVKEMYK